MQKRIGAAIVFLIIVGCGAYLYEHAGTDTPLAQLPSGERRIEVAGQTLTVDLATTSVEREQGLSGRAGLGADRGMLFVFPQDGVYKFWMKEMRFSLDIIWLSATGTVVSIEPDLAPSTYPQAYGPDVPARYVLEVNAGFSASHGLKAGDQVGL